MRVLASAALTLVLAVSGCSTTEPDPVEAPVTQIPARVEAALAAEERAHPAPAPADAWAAEIVTERGRTGFADRALAPCLRIDVPTPSSDRRSHDAAATTFATGRRYLVQRQVSLFADTADAVALVDDLDGYLRAVCGPIAADRAGHLAHPDQETGLLVATGADQARISTGWADLGHDAAWVDVVTRTGNAVALTRVLDPWASGPAGEPLTRHALTRARETADLLAFAR